MQEKGEGAEEVLRGVVEEEEEVPYQVKLGLSGVKLIHEVHFRRQSLDPGGQQSAPARQVSKPDRTHTGRGEQPEKL